MKEFKKYIKEQADEMDRSSERLEREKKHADQILKPHDPTLADLVKKKVDAEFEKLKYIKKRTDKQSN